MEKKIGVLLINLGTPDSPKVGDVRKYLSEFLNDPRVIDIPWLLRKILVNLIIVPFRAPKSAKIYKELFDLNGGTSPLLVYGEILRDKLGERFRGDNVTFELAMRYGNPSLNEVCARMEKAGYDEVIVFPLFPQYASASTGSALEKAMRLIKDWYVIPEIKVISQYYDHPGYINTVVERAKKYDIKEYDHILFSYHGLPVRQVDKVYEDRRCDNHNCENEINEENRFCYKATCYATTRLIAEKLGLSESDYTVCFQSRLDKKWLEPFSDKIVEEWGRKGAKKLLAFSPAFVADCLETSIEIGDEYQEIFEEHGGEKVQLVESLNDHPLWIDTCEQLVKERL
ncbi:MAG: ferrochelatase [Cryomorphaceae bacterium]|nr:ferrochelatase [Flavobacteriales bacterium]